MKKILALISCSGLILTGCNVGGSDSLLAGQPQASLKIQNGIPVTEPVLNSMVPLIYVTHQDEQGKQYASICTGTLIATNKVLTAAHCVIDMAKKPSNQVYTSANLTNPGQIKVIFNKDKSVPLDLAVAKPANLEIYSVKNSFVHAQAFQGSAVLKSGSLKIYNVNNLNDVAVLELATQLDPMKYSIARLPQAIDYDLAVNSKLTIVGYGIDSGKEVEVFDPFQGNAGALRYAVSKLAGIQDNYIYVYGRLDPVLGYTKICQGDSGGPDFIVKNNQYTVLGVHSFGEGRGCGVPGRPGASLNVMHYLDWINHDYLNNHL